VQEGLRELERVLLWLWLLWFLLPLWLEQQPLQLQLGILLRFLQLWLFFWILVQLGLFLQLWFLLLPLLFVLQRLLVLEKLERL
jgi:hypothetical protein